MYFRFALSFGDVELMISDLTENCKLQFSSTFVDFALGRVTLHAES